MAPFQVSNLSNSVNLVNAHDISDIIRYRRAFSKDELHSSLEPISTDLEIAIADVKTHLDHEEDDALQRTGLDNRTGGYIHVSGGIFDGHSDHKSDDVRSAEKSLVAGAQLTHGESEKIHLVDAFHRQQSMAMHGAMM